jgi:hypothetical protein
LRWNSHFAPIRKLAPPRREVVVGRDRLGALVDHPQLQVVLQVLAHARQVVRDRHAHLAQMRRRPDAGEQQELRALQRARREDHLAPRGHLPRLAALPVLDAARAPVVEHDARRLRVRLDAQVRARSRRLQVADRGAAAPAVVGEELVVADAFLHAAVEVVGARHAELVRAGDDRLDQLVLLADVRALERPVRAVRRRRAALVALAADEVRQHVAPAPPRVAVARPAVVVLGLAAHVDQAVDRRAAAEPATARPVHAASVHPRIGVRREPPVVDRVEHRLAVPDRDVDPEVVVLGPRFEHQHARAAVGAQAVREHAARGAAADDHVVECIHVARQQGYRNMNCCGPE